MSDTTTPAPASTPAAPNPQPPKVSKTAGCFGVVLLVIVISWLADLAGCNKPEESQADKLMKDMAGTDNPLAQKIQGLSTANAYSVGYKDGIQEFASLGQKFSQMQGDMMDQLRNAQEAKNSFFDLLATQNKFDAAVFTEYRRGWNAGWNNHSVTR